MKVKVGNKLYSAENEPVMVILTDKDKRNISNMDPKATKYVAYPEGMDSSKISKWVSEKVNRVKSKYWSKEFINLTGE